MKENLELIKQHLLIVFDDVEIEYDKAPVIRFWFKQNGKRILRNIYKATSEKQITELSIEGVKQFAKGMAMDIMYQFIEEGI